MTFAKKYWEFRRCKRNAFIREAAIPGPARNSNIDSSARTGNFNPEGMTRSCYVETTIRKPAYTRRSGGCAKLTVIPQTGMAHPKHSTYCNAPITQHQCPNASCLILHPSHHSSSLTTETLAGIISIRQPILSASVSLTGSPPLNVLMHRCPVILESFGWATLACFPFGTFYMNAQERPYIFFETAHVLRLATSPSKAIGISKKRFIFPRRLVGRRYLTCQIQRICDLVQFPARHALQDASSNTILWYSVRHSNMERPK